MARDSTGTERVNMFEDVRDDDSGVLYTPVRRNGTKVVYRSTDGAGELTVSDYRRSGRDLTAERYYQSQIASSPLPGRAVVATRTARKRR